MVKNIFLFIFISCLVLIVHLPSFLTNVTISQRNEMPKMDPQNFPKDVHTLTNAHKSTKHIDTQLTKPENSLQFTEGGEIQQLNTNTLAKGNESNTEKPLNISLPNENGFNYNDPDSSGVKLVIKNTETQDNKTTSIKPNINSVIATNVNRILLTPKVNKKPLITISSDELPKPKYPASSEQMEQKITVKDENNIPVKKKALKPQPNVLSTSHPEFVLPVVITILVVPMFALLGYLAIRRGREAWKNRHYRRMDFLIDGMYND